MINLHFWRAEGESRRRPGQTCTSKEILPTTFWPFAQQLSIPRLKYLGYVPRHRPKTRRKCIILMTRHGAATPSNGQPSAAWTPEFLHTWVRFHSIVHLPVQTSSAVSHVLLAQQALRYFSRHATTTISVSNKFKPELGKAYYIGSTAVSPGKPIRLRPAMPKCV